MEIDGDGGQEQSLMCHLCLRRPHRLKFERGIHGASRAGHPATLRHGMTFMIMFLGRFVMALMMTVLIVFRCDRVQKTIL